VHRSRPRLLDRDRQQRRDPADDVDVDGPNRLYRNDGRGYFRDVGAATGVADPGPSQSAAWGDYDGDGYLDL